MTRSRARSSAIGKDRLVVRGSKFAFPFSRSPDAHTSIAPTRATAYHSSLAEPAMTVDTRKRILNMCSKLPSKQDAAAGKIGLPHCTIEYSANLDAEVDMTKLCAEISDAIMTTGLFEKGAVRVRALPCVHYSIADGLPGNAFLDMSFRIGRGRTHEEKRRAGEAIFAVASHALKTKLASPYFALSLEIREIDADLSWKSNSMHRRLRVK